jgi:hypothetical protein
MTSIHRTQPGSISKPFQQTLDIVELDLRAVALPGPAAQFIEDLAGFLQGVLIGNLDIPLIEGTVIRHRPAEGVALDLVPRLAVGGSDIIIIRIAAAQAALHLLGEFAGRLLQLIEGFGLRTDRFARLTTLQRLSRIAHRPFGTPEGPGNFTEAVAESAHHVAEHSPQALLLTGGVAHLGVRFLLIATLLPALTHPALLTLLLRSKASIKQLLLALHKLVHSAHHLLRFTRAALRHLSRLRHPQIFEHVLQLRQELARLVARTVPRELSRPVDHTLKITTG